jgi:hypothetical protein
MAIAYARVCIRQCPPNYFFNYLVQFKGIGKVEYLRQSVVFVAGEPYSQWRVQLTRKRRSHTVLRHSKDRQTSPERRKGVGAMALGPHREKGASILACLSRREHAYTTLFGSNSPTTLSLAVARFLSTAVCAASEAVRLKTLLCLLSALHANIHSFAITGVTCSNTVFTRRV